MRLLLDTHVALWAIGHPGKLTADIRGLLSDRANEIFVSVVTVWEIAIKYAVGQRTAPLVSAAEAAGYFRASGSMFLDVTTEHAIAVENLPRIHGEPFDRLLVAQALTEPLRLITRDREVAGYSDTVILF